MRFLFHRENVGAQTCCALISVVKPRAQQACALRADWSQLNCHFAALNCRYAAAISGGDPCPC
jgi:hypothetical protein